MVTISKEGNLKYILNNILEGLSNKNKNTNRIKTDDYNKEGYRVIVKQFSLHYNLI